MHEALVFQEISLNSSSLLFFLTSSQWINSEKLRNDILKFRALIDGAFLDLSWLPLIVSPILNTPWHPLNFSPLLDTSCPSWTDGPFLDPSYQPTTTLIGHPFLDHFYLPLIDRGFLNSSEFQLISGPILDPSYLLLVHFWILLASGWSIAYFWILLDSGDRWMISTSFLPTVDCCPTSGSFISPLDWYRFLDPLCLSLIASPILDIHASRWPIKFSDGPFQDSSQPPLIDGLSLDPSCTLLNFSCVLILI